MAEKSTTYLIVPNETVNTLCVINPKKWKQHAGCLVFAVFHLSTGINYKENIFKALILLGGSYCTYSSVFRRKRVQVLHLLKFLPVVVYNFAAAHHVLR